MISFTTEQRAAFHQMAVTMFDADSLKLTLLMRMGLRLGNVVELGRPFEHVMMDLLDHIESTGELEKLLRTFVKVRPERDDLRIFCRANFPVVFEEAPPAPRLVNWLNQGVLEIINRLSDPSVRQGVGQFQAEFRTIERQIHVLAHYKRLHEILHLLQRQLPIIHDAVDRFPVELAAVMQLSPARLALKVQIDRARECLPGLPTEHMEETWVDDFESAVERARVAWSQRDKDAMSQAVRELRRLLLELPRIDGQLAVVVSQLPLLGLGTTLKNIAEHLQESDATTEGAMATLSAALRSLGLLRPELQGLVNEHNEWQWLDKELAGIDTSSEPRPIERIPRWEKVRARLTGLCEAYLNDTSWAASILGHIKAWEEHAAQFGEVQGAMNLPPKAGDVLTSVALIQDVATLCAIEADSLRAHAINRFLKVDSSLLELCEELVNISEPINSLLEAYTHD